MLSVVFFGTPTFALPTLQALIDSPDIAVQAVVSQPDRPQGRGKKLQPTPVKTLAIANGIPIWQPDRIKKSTETLTALEHLKADVFVVVAYGQLLSKQILDMPRLGCVNVHGSLLPAYRGAAPIQWAIANGETETGNTTMLMDVGMDTGEMLLKRSVVIEPNWTAIDLAERLAPMGADLLLETLVALEAGTIRPEPQADEIATYAPLLSKDNFRVDWSQDAAQLHNQIRAFSPNCFSEFDGKRCKIMRSHPPIHSSEHPDTINQQSSQTPGTVIDIIKGQGFAIQTGAGSLRIKEIQLAGKKVQSAWDFANGVRLEVGQQFGGDR